MDAERLTRIIAGVKATGQAPLLGIPVEGGPPFVVSRDRFRKVFNDGMEVASAGWTAGPNGIRALEVTGRHGRVKSRTVMYDTLTPASRWLSVVRPLHDWAEKRRKRPPRPARSKHEVVLARLRKELDALPDSPPVHPMLAHLRWQGTAGEYERRNALTWRQEKAERRRIGRYFATFKRMSWPLLTLDLLYHLLRAGQEHYRPYSKLSRPELDRYGMSYRQYADHLYRYAGTATLLDKPGCLEPDGDKWWEGEDGHSQSRREYAEVIRQRQALKSQIATIEELRKGEEL